jgi:hypothetical protein
MYDHHATTGTPTYLLRFIFAISNNANTTAMDI